MKGGVHSPIKGTGQKSSYEFKDDGTVTIIRVGLESDGLNRKTTGIVKSQITTKYNFDRFNQQKSTYQITAGKTYDDSNLNIIVKQESRNGEYFFEDDMGYLYYKLEPKEPVVAQKTYKPPPEKKQTEVRIENHYYTNYNKVYASIQFRYSQDGTKADYNLESFDGISFDQIKSIEVEEKRGDIKRKFNDGFNQEVEMANVLLGLNFII